MLADEEFWFLYSVWGLDWDDGCWFGGMNMIGMLWVEALVLVIAEA